MTALTANINRQVTGGEFSTIRLSASEIPFAGSALVHELDGYASVLDSGNVGMPFAGFATAQVKSGDHPASPADGDMTVHIRKGIFFAVLTISAVALDDAAHGRLVYASDDNAFSFTPSGTLIGQVWEMQGTEAVVLCVTHGYEGVLGARAPGVKTLAATGAQALTTADLGKLVLIPSTGAYALTLPLVADCTGRGFTFKKTTANAVACTLTGAGSENIDGSNTNATIDAAQDMLEIVSDGAAWHIVSSKLA